MNWIVPITMCLLNFAVGFIVGRVNNFKNRLHERRLCIARLQQQLGGPPRYKDGLCKAIETLSRIEP